MNRILVATHDYTVTGAPIALWLLMAKLAERFEITVVSPLDGPLRQRFEDAGIQTLVDPNLHKDPAVTQTLLKDHDCLFGNTIISMGPVIHAGATGKRILWYIHEVKEWADDLVNRREGATRAFETAHEVLTPCNFTRQLYQPWRKAPIKILPYGVADREEIPAHEPSDKLRLLMLASIQRNKGHDLALGALKQLNDPRLSLRIVGSTMQKDFLEECKAIDTGQCAVEWAGSISDETKKLAELDACDALVVPSRDEVTPVVIYEAMMAGKPVIAATVGGIPEYVHHGVTGYLVRPESSASIASRLRCCLADRDELLRIGAAAREWMRKSRTLAHYADAAARFILGEGESLPAARPVKRRPKITVAPAKETIGDAMAQAQAAAAAGRHAQAVDICQQVLRERPRSPEVHNNLANVFYMQGKYEEAIESYKRSLEIKPDHIDAAHNLAKVYQALGRWQEAVERFRQVQQLRPDWKHIPKTIALIYYGAGQYKEAAEMFVQILGPSAAGVS